MSSSNMGDDLGDDMKHRVKTHAWDRHVIPECRDDLGDNIRNDMSSPNAGMTFGVTLRDTRDIRGWHVIP